MKFSQLTVDLQEQIALGAFNTKVLTAPQAIQLEDLTPIKLWEIISPRLKHHATHYAHESIFAPDPREDRKEFADAIAVLLTDRQYVVIDQNPWAGRRLSIETPKPGNVKCSAEAEFINIHDSYGIWCSLVPHSVDLWKGELVFRVTTRDHRDSGEGFMRTFRFIRNSSDPAWEVIDRLFYTVYPRPNTLQERTIEELESDYCLIKMELAKRGKKP